MVQRRACVQADDHWRARHDIARVIARPLTTQRPADDRTRVDLCERVGGVHHLERGPERSHISGRPDCARSRSPDGRGPRAALGAAPRRRPQHDRQPPRCEEGLRRERALRDGWAVARGRLAVSRIIGGGPLLSGDRQPCGRRDSGPRGVHRFGRSGGRARALLQALLPRRRDQPARDGAGTRSRL